MTSRITLAIAVAAATFAAGPAVSGDYYEDRDITLLVGFSPGGGTDRFARLIADHLGRYVDGEPNVTVQNMPGAGSVLASNYFVSPRTARDGETLMVGTGQLLMRIMLGLEGSVAALDDYQPLFAGPQGRMTFARSELGIESAADMVDGTRDYIHGSGGILVSIDTLMGVELLGIEPQVITGYPGKAETLLAFERGEVNLDGQTTGNIQDRVVPMIEEGIAIPMFTQGFVDDEGNLARDPTMPEFASVLDVYREIHGEDPSGPAWSSYLAMTAATVNLGRVIKAHRETPQEALDALNAAFARMEADPEFIAAAESQMAGYMAYGGEPLMAAVEAAVSISDEDLDWIREFLSTKHGVSFD